MRLLKEREEIGRAMNFGKYPVLHINMENNKAVQIIVEDDYQVKHPIYETLRKRKEGEAC